MSLESWPRHCVHITAKLWHQNVSRGLKGMQLDNGVTSVAECDRVWTSVTDCGRVWPSVIECGRVWSNVTECGRVWLSVTSPTAAMCCLNADSNNNAVQSRCSCFSTFRDWIQRIGMRSRGWRDDLPHSLVVVQIILSTVKPCASLSTIIRFHVLLTKRSFHRLMYFKCLKSLYLIWNKLMLFYLPSSLTNKCTIY